MQKHVSKSIFDGETVIIPLAEVAYIEKQSEPPLEPSICIYFSSNVYCVLRGLESESFLTVWRTYRNELERVDDDKAPKATN